MDAVLCLPEATYFQSMEFERPEAICGLESGTRSRLWSTRGDCACRQEVVNPAHRIASSGLEFCSEDNADVGFMNAPHGTVRVALEELSDEEVKVVRRLPFGLWDLTENDEKAA